MGEIFIVTPPYHPQANPTEDVNFMIEKSNFISPNLVYQNETKNGAQRGAQWNQHFNMKIV